MACFDIHVPRAGGELVVDVQSDLVDILNTRVAVPLIPPARAPAPARRLNPVFTLPGTGPVVFVAQYIAALPAGELGPAVGSLAVERDAIRDALDMLFLGF
jgi:toxin CcdB